MATICGHRWTTYTRIIAMDADDDDESVAKQHMCGVALDNAGTHGGDHECGECDAEVEQDHMPPANVRSVYQFRIQEPVDRDTVVLIFTRYDYSDNSLGQSEFRSYVYTTTGWQEYGQGFILPGNLPHIDGIDLHSRRKQMDDFIKQVKAMLTGHNSQHIHPLPRVDWWGQIILALNAYETGQMPGQWPSEVDINRPDGYWWPPR